MDTRPLFMSWHKPYTNIHQNPKRKGTPLDLILQRLCYKLAALTGGSCHQSPDVMRFKPPKGRFEPSGRRANALRDRALVQFTSRAPKTPAARASISSMTKTRMLWHRRNRASMSGSPCFIPRMSMSAELMGMAPHECTVFPYPPIV